jgi:SAM-dependent methyltransferase
VFYVRERRLASHKRRALFAYRRLDVVLLAASASPDARCRSDPPGRRMEAREAFNLAADTLDEIPLWNPTSAWMREVSRREIVRSVRPGGALLEIGCGTGADAAYFARLGHRVLALDISDRMVERAQERARNAGLEGSMMVLRGRVSELSERIESSPWAPFDAAYANFSLAYEPSLREAAGAVHRTLAGRGPFLFTLPNRICPAEMMIALGRLRPASALVRFRARPNRNLSGIAVPFRAYTPPEVRRELQGLFHPDSALGVPVFCPPPGYYRPEIEAYLRPLRSLDRRFCASFPWNALGDHTLFSFHRIPG